MVLTEENEISGMKELKELLNEENEINEDKIKFVHILTPCNH